MGLYEQMPSLANLYLDRLLEFVTRYSAAQKRWTTWSRHFAAAVLDPDSSKPRGIFSSILSARDSHGKRIGQSELWAEGSFLMLAGIPTSLIGILPV